MLTVKLTRSFRADYKLCVKRHYPMHELDVVVDTLASQKPLDKKYKDHPLSGNWFGYRECHVQPDWVLIYRIDGKNLLLILTHTGTHSDLLER